MTFFRIIYLGIILFVLFNSKFGYGQKLTVTTKINSIASALANEDLELSPVGLITSTNQISGWTITKGAFSGTNNACNLVDCCPNAPIESAIISSSVNGYIDPVIGPSYPIYSVFGVNANNGYSLNPTITNMAGDNFLRINSSTPDFSIEKASKTISVTPANALFQLAFIGVYYNGHNCCDAGSFQIKLTNATSNATLSCPGLSLYAPGSPCNNTTQVVYYGGPNIYYNKWKVVSFNFSQYIGQAITIDLIANDCVAGGHYGYAYVDAQSLPMNIMCNSNSISAISNTILLSSCGATSAALTAPPGLGPYSWAGPGINLQQSTPSFTNQSISLLLAGNYTLTMNPLGACGPISKILNVSMTPSASPLSIAGTNSVCSNVSVSFTVNGASSYLWSNGANTNTMTDSPITNTVYIVNSLDNNNCPNATTINVTVIQQPTLSVIGPSSVCIGSSVTYSVIGANLILWNSVQITNSINVLPSTSTTYSIKGYNNTCSTSLLVNLFVDASCADVWPGDANSDGVVNNLDVLELGLHFSQSGLPRNPTSNVWQAWHANNWVGTITGGKNLCHSDCNGNGVINESDGIPIGLNYNLNHSFKENTSKSSIQDLHLVSDQAFLNNNQWGSVSINLGDPSNDISSVNGIAYNLNFENNFIQTDSIFIVYPNSFINMNNDNFHFNKNNFPNGVIYSASTHTNNINVTGNGKVATFHFKVAQAIGFDTVVKVNLSSAFKSNASGSLSSLSTGSVAVSLKALDVGLVKNAIDETILIYPNPSNGILKVLSKKELSRVEVYTFDGRLVFIEFGKTFSYTFNLSAQKDGVYFIKVIDVNNVSRMRKLSIMKE